MLGSPEDGEAMSAGWGSGLFTWLPRRLGEGPPGEERTLYLKGPHLAGGWPSRGEGGGGK